MIAIYNKDKEGASILNVEKTFYQSFMKNLFSDPCEVVFWDGEEVSYGEGIPQFRLVFNEPLSKSDVLSDPSLAFGEGYMNKKFDIQGNIQKVIESLYNNQGSFLRSQTYFKLAKRLSQSFNKNKENIEFHYDIGNDFYSLWLDETMTYSCAYFKSSEDTLTQAQKNKVEHILKKLNLQSGETLLDIGCGWGELIITAAKQYKVKAMGVTLSSEQYHQVKERIDKENLKDLVDVQLMDYREIKNVTFDKVVSVGMLEHVGREHLKEYFKSVETLLNNGGISLLHCITGYKDKGGTNSWINKYIFPGGYIPNVQELINHMALNNFYLMDAESLRKHYARTLEIWAKNFEKALPIIKQQKDEAFIRMWRLYLNSCAASFHCGNIDLHQFLFSKGVNNNWPMNRAYMYQ
jgi:cyclopropane-fatty-acyl-phospholipid synthase